MLTFQASDKWKQAYPEAHAGVLVMRGAANPAQHPALEERKAALEQDLRERHAGQDRSALLHNPILQAYAEYYRQFKKTYHIQLQLESLLFKGKSLPSVAALVECMFMAEMDGLLLTAGHDLDSVRGPLTLDVASGTETYTLLRGDPQPTKPGDMLIRDQDGIISSIVYGPDQRTQITSATRDAIFTIYAPSGIRPDDVRKQLAEIRDYVLIIAPTARADLMEVYGAA